jgi:uncharacterized PurR-regulated membrane protein YhhQ (DUF165 family)
VALSWPARDLVQLGGSRLLGIAAIFVGALVSWWVANPAIAVASGGTLLISETADFLVYTPMQRRLVWAVVLSSLIGAVLDSIIFLSWSGIGFGPGGVILKGQIVGKATTVLLIGLPVALMLRRTDSVKELLPA